ncbi:MAG: hypothetical protein HY536_02030 [Candidatus Colwellbacteria bacterium]|nr:hypothetical protein [Candidatus Colwellbacteria bacterium]
MIEILNTAWAQEFALKCTTDCTSDQIFEFIYQLIAYAFTYLLPLVVTGYFIYGAYFLMAASIIGETEKTAKNIAKGKKVMGGAVIGFGIALLAWAVVNTIFSSLTKCENWSVIGGLRCENIYYVCAKDGRCPAAAKEYKSQGACAAGEKAACYATKVECDKACQSKK